MTTATRQSGSRTASTMDVYVVRHAVAYERDATRWPDDRKRPLTAKGRRRFAAMAAWLRRNRKGPNAVLSSSLVRAQETADLLVKHARWPKPRDEPGLVPDAHPNVLWKHLQRKRLGAVVACVGHEPHLSTFVSYALFGTAGQSRLVIKKGGFAHLRIPRRGRPGSAELRCLVSPKDVS